MKPEQISALFDGPVGVGVTDPRRPSGFLFPQEEAALTRARPKRRNEFQAGRTAARAALTALKGPACALPPDEDGLPQWPRGYAGSISHCDTLCLAAVTRTARAIGLDVEPATPLESDLWDTILLPQEQDAIRDTAHPGLMAKMIFSAKESAYKAQFQISRILFDFHGMQITWNAAGSFSARFLIPAAPFASQDRVNGHFLIDSDYIVTTAALD